MNRITVTLLLILTLLVSSCAQKVVATGEAEGAPAGCGVQDVAQRLFDFTDAINRHDPKLASDFFDPTLSFMWYYASDGAKTGEDAIVRSAKDLPVYFERRQAQHEPLHFRKIRVNGYDERGLVNFEFTVRRQADDFNGGVAKDVVGKGALQCGSHTFVVLNIGDN